MDQEQKVKIRDRVKDASRRDTTQASQPWNLLRPWINKDLELFQKTHMIEVFT